MMLVDVVINIVSYVIGDLLLEYIREKKSFSFYSPPQPRGVGSC